MTNFDALASRNMRRLVPAEVEEEETPLSLKEAVAMTTTAQTEAVKKVLIPKLRARIEELDELETAAVGDAAQFVYKGRRLEAKEMLGLWLEWSGQAPVAPDKGD